MAAARSAPQRDAVLVIAARVAAARVALQREAVLMIAGLATALVARVLIDPPAPRA